MEYKNLHSYKDFLNEKKKFIEEEKVNEGLLKDLFNFLGKKLKHYYNKIKAAKVIDPLIEEAKKNLKELYDNKEFIESRKKRVEELKKNTDDKNTETEKTEVEVGQVGESKLYEENVLTDYVTNLENTESKDPMMKIMDNFLKNLKEKIKSTLITKDVGVKDGKLTPLTSAYLQLKIFEIEDQIIKENMEYMVKEAGLSEEQAAKVFEEAEKRNKESIDKLSQMMDKKFEEEEANKKSNDEVVKGQMNNITDEDKKKENEENKDIEADKWVKVKTEKSDFYVKKGKLKKIEKKPEENKEGGEENKGGEENGKD